MSEKSQLPTIKELYDGTIEKSKQNDLNVLLNQPPNPKWLKKHPMGNFKYLPIGRVEYLLTRLFINWYIEIIECKLIANSVVVTIRLFYQDPVTGQIKQQDGIGANPLQTNKEAGAIEFNEIKTNAVQLAAPAAESYAIKDAAEKIGKLFGKDMNRADQISYDSLLGNIAGELDKKTVEKINSFTDKQKLIDWAMTQEHLQKLSEFTKLVQEKSQELDPA